MVCDRLCALRGPAPYTMVPEELGTLGRSRKEAAHVAFLCRLRWGSEDILASSQAVEAPPSAVNKLGGLKDLAHKRGREAGYHQFFFETAGPLPEGDSSGLREFMFLFDSFNLILLVH